MKRLWLPGMEDNWKSVGDKKSCFRDSFGDDMGFGDFLKGVGSDMNFLFSSSVFLLFSPPNFFLYSNQVAAVGAASERLGGPILPCVPFACHARCFGHVFSTAPRTVARLHLMATHFSSHARLLWLHAAPTRQSPCQPLHLIGPQLLVAAS